MAARPKEAVNAELMHVMWVLEEAPRWDASEVNRAARAYLVERYQKQERILRTVLQPERVEVKAPTPIHPERSADGAESKDEGGHSPPVSEGPSTPVLRTCAQDEEAQSPPPQPPRPPVAERRRPASRSTHEERVVEAASSWSRIWKPFLNESVGWFIGAFLILAGTLYWVNDAWQSMSQSVQALTVFGLAGAWTLGFAGWARFLERREATKSAAKVVKLIAAAVSPLAPVALGPIVGSTPWLVFPALALWSACTFVLARSVTRDWDQKANPHLPLTMVLTTVMMGLAPLAAALGPAAIWLTALPTLTLVLSMRRGPRADATQAAFAALAPLALVTMFAVRLAVAQPPVDALAALGSWSPFLAAAAGALLWLRKPTRAADVLSVGAVSLLVMLLAASVLGAAPSFFVVSAVLCAVGFKLSFERTSPRSAWWMVAAYAGAHFAFQSCGQLVPGVVRQLVVQVKAALGYAGGNLPPSYDAIYAAVFVVAAALFAVWQQRRRSWLVAAEANVVITCTAWASALVGALGLWSLGTDARPALWSAPVLAALCLTLGVQQSRALLTRIGSGLVVVSGAALAFSLQLPWGGLAMAVLALVAAVASVPMLRDHRWPLRLASVVLAMTAVPLAWVTPAGLVSVATLAIACAALMLVARDANHPRAMEAAWLLAAAVPARLMLVLAPDAVFFSLAVSAVVLAMLSRRDGRWSTTSVATVVCALIAPALQLGVQLDQPRGPVLLGATLVVSALALLLTRHSWRFAFALPMLAFAALPLKMPLQTFDFLQPMHSAAIAMLVAFACSARALLRENSKLLRFGATLAVAVAWVAVVVSHGNPTVMTLAALATLVSSCTLPAPVMLPLSSVLVLGATWQHPLAALLCALGYTAIAYLRWFGFEQRAAKVMASASALVVTVGFIVGSGYDGLLVSGIVLGVLTLAWLRASRFVGFGALLPVAFFLVDADLFAQSRLFLVSAIGLVACTRLLSLRSVISVILSGGEAGVEGSERTARMHAGWLRTVMVVASVVLSALPVVFGEVSGIPLAIGLLLAAAEPAAFRIVAAAGFALFVPGAAGLAAVVLLALAFSLQLMPKVTEVVLGSRRHAFTIGSAALSAVACAAWQLLLAPKEWMPASLLVVTVFATALLLGWRWLLPVAALIFSALAVYVGDTHRMHALLALGSMLVAALSAAMIRHQPVAEVVSRLSARLGRGWAGPLTRPLWLGAVWSVAILAVAMHAQPLTLIPALALAVSAALLLITSSRVEMGVAAAMVTLVAGVLVPDAYRSSVIAALGVAFAFGGTALERRYASGRVMHHAGWMMAVLALVVTPGLHAVGTPVTIALAVVAAWALVARKPAHEIIAWGATLAGLHAGLLFAGLNLSTGQPHELILPWLALASMLVGAVVLLLPRTTGRQVFGIAALVLGQVELLGGVVLLDAVYLREAVVAGVACLLAIVALVRSVARDDDATSSVLLQLTVALGVVSARWLGLHEAPGVFEAFLTLVAGVVAGGLSKWLEGAQRPKVAATARLGAWAWPVVGMLAAPYETHWLVALLLLAQAIHYGVLSRFGVMRRRMAVASAVAFNAALLFGYLDAQWVGVQYLAIPLGLSLLVLVRVFRHDFTANTEATLRGVAMTLIYAAAAWQPLAMNDPRALFICVLICVLGVAVGIALRIRSFVLLGTGFLVTSVVASLVRYGIHEPRIGALLLSALGLLVVGFMVLITTRRSELLQRYQAARQMLAQWEA